MRSIIVGFSGRKRSGKTTLSSAVAERLGWHRVSFGDFIRNEARRKGLGESIEILQDLGATFMENSDEFCRAVLKQAEWKPGRHLVIDGMRHTKMMDSLLRLTNPSKLLLIFIRVDERTLKDRRGKEKQENIEKHSTEVEVLTTLPVRADLVIDGARPAKVLIQEILVWLRKKIEIEA